MKQPFLGFLVLLAGCSSVNEGPIQQAGPGEDDAGPVVEDPTPVPCEGGEDLVFRITQIEQPISDIRSQTIGFNLDEVVSDGTDLTGCSFADKRTHDGVPGIDNQLEEVLNGLNLDFDLAGELNAALNDGTVVAELHVLHFDSYDFDTCVDLGMYFSGGVPDQLVSLMRGRVANGVLTTELGEIEGVIPIAGPMDMHLVPAQIEFAISPEAVSDGVLGAAVSVEQVVDIFAAGAPEYVDIARLVLESNADMPFGDEDCTAVSAALSFEGVAL